MIKVKFSQQMIQYLPVYLGVTMNDFISEDCFKYGKSYLYRMISGTAPITDSVNTYFNEYWKMKGLTQEDMNNLYQLIELVETGKRKQNRYTFNKNI